MVMTVSLSLTHTHALSRSLTYLLQSLAHRVWLSLRCMCVLARFCAPVYCSAYGLSLSLCIHERTVENDRERTELFVAHEKSMCSLVHESTSTFVWVYVCCIWQNVVGRLRRCSQFSVYMKVKHVDISVLFLRSCKESAWTQRDKHYFSPTLSIRRSLSTYVYAGFRSFSFHSIQWICHLCVQRARNRNLKFSLGQFYVFCLLVDEW